MVQASDFHAPTPPSMSPLLESKNLGQGTPRQLEMAGTKGDRRIYRIGLVGGRRVIQQRVGVAQVVNGALTC